MHVDSMRAGLTHFPCVQLDNFMVRLLDSEGPLQLMPNDPLVIGDLHSLPPRSVETWSDEDGSGYLLDVQAVRELPAIILQREEEEESARCTLARQEAEKADAERVQKAERADAEREARAILGRAVAEAASAERGAAALRLGNNPFYLPESEPAELHSPKEVGSGWEPEVKARHEQEAQLDAAQCDARFKAATMEQVAAEPPAEASLTSAKQVEEKRAKKKRQAAKKAEEAATASADAAEATAQDVKELVGAAVPPPYQRYTHRHTHTHTAHTHTTHTIRH